MVNHTLTYVMVSHHSLPATPLARCECGRIGQPIFDPADRKRIICYVCPKHGYLHHSAIVYERSNMEQPKNCHVVYVRDDTQHMVINGVFKEEDEDAAFLKARELYGAFDEVAVAKVPEWQP